MKLTQLLEMAVPSEAVKSKTYWHGTDTLKAAKSILKNGLDPVHTDIKYEHSKSFARPIQNRVYITPDINYAAIYALGSNQVGSMVDHSETDVDMKIWRKDPYGYMFEFAGKDLTDVQPDEDCVGELLSAYINHQGPYVDKVKNDAKLREILGRVSKYVNPSTRAALKKRPGYVEFEIKAGKQALSKMSNADKLELLKYDTHVGHYGKLLPIRAYKFSKRDAMLHDNSKPIKSIFMPFTENDLESV